MTSKRAVALGFVAVAVFVLFGAWSLGGDGGAISTNAAVAQPGTARRVSLVESTTASPAGQATTMTPTALATTVSASTVAAAAATTDTAPPSAPRLAVQVAADPDAQLARIRACVRRTPGYYWRRSASGSGVCLPLPGWALPLQAHEVSARELSCRALVARNSASSDYDTKNGTSSTPPSASARFLAFQRRSARLFEQWVPYDQLPAPTPPPATQGSAAASAADRGGRFRSMHDPSVENIFALSDFCVTAAGAGSLMAFGVESVGRYRGREETRGMFHSNDAFAQFLSAVRVIGGSARDDPAIFDARPAILVPLARETRCNIGHTMHRVLVLLGMLRMPALLASGANRTTDQSSVFATVKPLIVFVELPTATSQQDADDAGAGAAGGGGAGRYEAFGLYLRALDLPWAVISAAAPGSADSTATLRDSGSDAESAMMCFRRGVAWQNCADCDADHAANESYSFSNWANVTGPRLDALSDLRRIVLCRCLGIRDPDERATSTTRLPRLFIDVRTRSRSTLDFGLFVEGMLAQLNASFSSIVFGEAWSGSLDAYIRQVHDSDVFIGVHGSAFSWVTMMRPGSIVIELAIPRYSCDGLALPAAKRHGPRCWFGRFADALRIQHTMIYVDGLFDAREGAPVLGADGDDDGAVGLDSDDSVVQSARTLSDERQAEHHARQHRRRHDVQARLPPSVIVQSAIDAAQRWRSAVGRRPEVVNGSVTVTTTGGGSSSSSTSAPSDSRQSHHAQQQQVFLPTNDSTVLRFTPAQRATHDAQLVADIFRGATSFVNLTADAARAIATRLQPFRGIRAASALYFEGCPVALWRIVLDHMLIARVDIATLRSRTRAGRSRMSQIGCVSSTAAELGAIAESDNPWSPVCGTQLCLYGDLARALAAR